ncbi:MAG: mannose-1-phosphate guanylyltransferase/mannose-6-phosphate isomerase [Arenicellales bacterium WSBS_2016_MAG_OTU3]
MLVPVILCGGSGSRLWPLSRKKLPKQFHALAGEKSLLQSTCSRLTKSQHAERLLLICNEEHRFLVDDQLAAINIKPAGIYLEPIGRNTAPAAAIGCIVAQKMHPDACVVIAPSDHAIVGQAAFVTALNQAYELAQKGRLVTFGVVPVRAETGYGYIKKGFALVGTEDKAFAVDEFIEKPDEATAQNYLALGDYLWNSGIFVFKAATFLQELSTNQPDIVAACERALDNAENDLNFVRLAAESFSQSPSDSIDCAVMEHTQNAAVIPLDCGWSDIGSWEGLWQFSDKDENHNVTSGDVVLRNVENTLVHSDDRLVVALGTKNLAIVDSKDTLLVADRSSVGDLKKLVEQLAQQGRAEIDVHTKVYRPWGSYESLVETPLFQVKHLILKPGAKISLQRHQHRSEHWVVVSGIARVTRGEEIFDLKQDESTFVLVTTVHQLENPGKIPLEVIEVQTGSYFGEDDIERFEDIYGRV